MILLVLACAQPGTVTVVDGRTGAPVDGVALAVTDEAGSPCAETPPPTAGGGHTVVPAGCTGGAWRLAVDGVGWWVPEPPRSAEGAVVTAWRVVPTGGVGRLRGEDLDVLESRTAVDLAALAEGVSVPYPLELPSTLPDLRDGDLLVLDAPELVVEPVLPGAARTFGTPELPLSFGPWFYLGWRVPAEGPPVREALDLGAAQVVSAGERRVTYLPAHLLAPGRYAVLAPTGGRAILVERPPEGSDPTH